MEDSLHTALVSDYQLYEIIQNHKLDKAIRDKVIEEFKNRKLDREQIGTLIERHNSRFTSNRDSGLELYIKLMILLFPFFVVIHGLVSGRMIAKGQKRKWNEYWICVCLGYIIWTAVVLLIARYSLSA